MNRLTTRVLWSCTLLVVGSSALSPAPLAADGLADIVTLTIDPTTSSVALGETIDLTVTVTNVDADDTPPLTIHLDITDPDQTTSVDPEDWTPTLSKRIGVLAAGDTTVVDWSIQPISPGTFATYAVALSPGADTIASSDVLDVHVADQRSLNPGGVLPIAIGVPSMIGVLLFLQIRLARRAPSRRRSGT